MVHELNALNHTLHPAPGPQAYYYGPARGQVREMIVLDKRCGIPWYRAA